MEVIVNGRKVILGNSMPALTKRSIDIKDLSARFIDVSNRFVIPDVNENRITFESPNGLGTSSRAFEKFYDVVISDVFQIFRGKGFLSQSTHNTFSLQVVDPSKEVFKLFDKKLKELSAGYDSMDTTLTATAIDALDSFDIDNVWFWGKACYHEKALRENTDQISGGGDARCKYSRPALNLQALLKLICAEAGYSFSPPTLQLAFTANHSDFFFTSYQKTLSGDNVVAGTANVDELDTDTFEQGVTTTDTTIDIGLTKTKFRIRGSITSTAVMTIIVRATDSIDSSKVSESQLTLQSGTFYYDFETAEFASDNDMDIELILSGTGTITFNSTLFYSLVSEKTKDLSGNPFLSYKIKAHDNLPDISFMDLFKTLCVAGNYQQDVNTFDKVFAFRSMAHLNKLLADDWSDKFIQKSETISKQTDGLFKINYLTYINDSTVRTDLGRAMFEVDNETLQESGEYLSLPFGASVDVVINSNTVAQVPCYNDTTRIVEPEPTMRLFCIATDKLQFAPISWDVLKLNYTELFDSLYKSRAISGEVNISKLDFLTWTPRRMCFIEYFDSTFIILGIENFIPGRATTINILKYGR